MPRAREQDVGFNMSEAAEMNDEDEGRCMVCGRLLGYGGHPFEHCKEQFDSQEPGKTIDKIVRGACLDDESPD